MKLKSSDIVFATRKEAELVVKALIEIAQQYAFATPADLYELIGKPSNHEDNEWAWINLPSASIRIRQTKKGYVIDLPPLEAI